MSDEVSGWNVWCHPKEYRDELIATRESLGETQAELEVCREALAAKEEECVKLQETLAKRESQIIDSRKENVELTSEKADLALKLAKAESTIMTLTDQLIKTRRELDENRILEKDMEEFAVNFEKALEMKKEYEKRIQDLRLRLRDAKSTIRMLSGEDNENELSVIDMKDKPAGKERMKKPEIRRPRIVSTGESEEKVLPQKPDVRTPVGNDWLNDLPDTFI